MTRLDEELARRFIPRRVWGARPPRSVTPFDPDFGDTVHYEGVNLGVFAHTTCASKVRGIQNFHMDAKGWVDVAYSDLGCPHGYVFEGRGPLVRTAANGTNEGNASAHATCALLGPDDAVTDELLWAMAVSAARLNRAAGLQRVNGHRDWKPTACPDDDLYAQLDVVRYRHAVLLAPAPDPAPPVPPITSGPTYPEDAVHRLLVNVPVADDDGNGTGRGYVDLRKGVGGLTETIGHDRVMDVFYGGDNPSDGWGPKAVAPAELVNAGGVARIVVPAHEVKTGVIGVYVTVAD